MPRLMNSFLRVLVITFFVVGLFNLAPNNANADHCGGRAPGHPGGSSAPCSAFITEDPLDPFGGPGDDVVVTGDDDGGGDGGDGVVTGTGTGVNGGNVSPSVVRAGDDTESMLYNGAVALGGWIASLGGGLFDLSIKYVVVEMGCWFTTEGDGCSLSSARGAVGGVVNELWTVVRDLFNILFIFSLVYIGLRMILFADDSSTRRTLGLLIMAALLINFSLYFTKVIVDVANYTAVTIHTVATSNLTGQFGFGVAVSTDGGAAESVVDYRASGSLAAAYMQTLKMSSWFANDPDRSWSHIIVSAIMVLIFSIILGFTLAYGALMLIGRFIALIVFMIVSPAMFLGWILPSFARYSSMWWSKFLRYAFFAPAYIFMLYVGLYTLIQIGAGFSIQNSNHTYSNAIGGSWSETMFLIFLYFAIGIGFLIAATKVGESMSSAGSATMMTGIKGIKQRALGASRWGAGYAASSAAGSAATWQGKRMDKSDAQYGAANPDYVPSRRRRALRSVVSKVESKKFGGSTSYKERAAGDKAAKDAQRQAVSKHTREQAVNDIKDKLKIANTAGATNAQIIAAEESLSNASRPQLLEVAKTNIKALEGQAGALTTADAKAIMDSDDVNDTDKQSFSKARSSAVEANITKRGGTLEKGLTKATGDELTEVDYTTTLTQNAGYLQEGQMEALKKKWGAESRKFQTLKLKREADMTSGAISIAELVDTRKDNKELAQLPAAILESSAFLNEAASQGKLNADLLRKIASENESVDKKKIHNNILAKYTTPGSGSGVPKDVDKYLSSPQGVDYTI